MFDQREVFVPQPAPPPRQTARAAKMVVLDVVIPTYNEEHRIGATLASLCRQISQSGYGARIILVDNGSVDSTLEVVERKPTYGVDVEVISCRDKGKGAAIRAGVLHATAPFVGFVDADQSTPPEALLTSVDLLIRGWDGVIGSRRALGGHYAVKQSRLRRIGSRFFNLAAATIVGGVSDTQCGMKVFRTDAVRNIFASTVTDGFAFDVEILARARAKGLRIMELPVTWSDSEGSSLSPLRDGVAAFRDLGRVRRLLHRHPKVNA